MDRRSIPEIRIRRVNDHPVRGDRSFVLYWMIAARRTRRNFALERALDLGAALDRPVLVLEALRAGYRWASARHHRFAIDGMQDNARRLMEVGVTYHGYVEPEPGAGAGLLQALGERSCAVVTDEYPTFFLPRMVASAGRRLDVRLEAVDSNGIVPLAASERAYPSAATFRRFFQKVGLEHLGRSPEPDPLAGPRRTPVPFPADVAARWPAADPALLDASDPEALARLPVDHAVPPVAERGGAVAAAEALDRFVEERLARYADDRNRPDLEVASGLSAWLHWGHLSIHDVAARVLQRDRWNPGRVAPSANGARTGWWGASPEVEAFLDEAIVWRELGYHFAWHRPDDHDRWEGLPDWARATLEEHAGDPRPHLYDHEAFETAATHDPLWNAAQRQLRTEGRIHNYLRMLWGKKILEWSPTPAHALETMTELNNRWAIDGRDPNSVSGIFWTLGRFDRPWGPERDVFGKIRYMTSRNTARKYDVRPYLDRWLAPDEAPAPTA